ncbi:polysaccharide pyruvyl transferase family protein [Allomuricauda sp. NBRC 101325]|uniref:polysaccharide pyruvyl transferase family protein n=1 Tax=Allomuricauda sp. NBRC 101325 TaxID=1113758 RepID=UPI0024A5D4AA|nr:polysaccharide pyruvyl transferase family protein [Muricauda sp. NBRC 101325]GLU43208.1 hypothetical protein Musp01_08320 [Muricauda sp. NBRC 101325]
MKIGILTYHYSDNYGAVLQTFALSNILRNHGHNAEIINLIPKKNLNQTIRKFFKDRLTYNFKSFRQNHLICKPNKPIVYHELKTLNFSNYDVIIVGSDQVWRKSYTQGLGYSYFLDFVPNGTKKVSYAASFGLDHYEGSPNDIKIVSELLKDFDLITTREQSGVEICEKTFKVKADFVLDPVLLSDSIFEKFIDRSNQNTFVTQYLLDPTDQKVSFVKNVSKYFDIPTKINYKQSNKPITLFNSIFKRSEETFPKVEDWINGIANSTFVVTDSFHGVAFSILFKKQFVCIINEKRGKTRMSNLLGILGLNHVGVSEKDLDTLKVNDITEIDYEIVNEKLSELRKKSLDYLLSIL